MCRPSVSPLTIVGFEHGLHAPPSASHSKVDPGSLAVKENETVPPLGSAGLAVIVVSGGVVSTLTLRIDDELWPALSVATTSSARLPSPGIVQFTEYGPGAAIVPSALNVPVEQSVLASEHSRNWTSFTPLPVSLAVAVKGVGLEYDALTDIGGAVMEIVGGTLSTRMFVFTTCVALPAASVAEARRS